MFVAALNMGCSIVLLMSSCLLSRAVKFVNDLLYGRGEWLFAGFRLSLAEELLDRLNQFCLRQG